MDSLNFISHLNNFSKLLTTNINYGLPIDINIFFKDISLNDNDIAIDTNTNTKQCIALVDKKGISSQCSRSAKCDGLCGLHTNRKNTFNTIYNNSSNTAVNSIYQVKIEFCNSHKGVDDNDVGHNTNDADADADDPSFINHYNFNSIEDYYKTTYENNIYLVHCHSGEVYLEKDHIHIGNILIIDIPLVI